jgi:hypothetical protein
VLSIEAPVSFDFRQALLTPGLSQVKPKQQIRHRQPADRAQKSTVQTSSFSTQSALATGEPQWTHP